MKVFFVQGHLQGCNYVRALLPMFANGWKGNIVGLNSAPRSPEEVSRWIAESDVVVFHRPETHYHHKVAIECQKLGKKVVFDNDDTFQLDHFHPFFAVDNEKFKENLKFKNNLLNNFMKNADLCTASTEYLAKEYREWNENVVVLPNCVDPADWPMNPKRNEGEKVRIGIVGSTAYAHDYEIAKDIISLLDKRDDVQLVLFGLNTFKEVKVDPEDKDAVADQKILKKALKKEMSFWKGLKNIEHIPWVDMKDYMRRLDSLKLDIMLIPRRENSFNKAKSNVKFLEAGMLEIPVIASSFSEKDSPYDADLNGKNGILVENTNEAWLEAVNDLIENKEKRREIGREAKKYVLENYHIQKHAHKWAEAYKKLLE